MMFVRSTNLIPSYLVLILEIFNPITPPPHASTCLCDTLAYTCKVCIILMGKKLSFSIFFKNLYSNRL